MTTSEFQRKKVSGVFAAMDVDQDGFLTEEDFTALTARWIGVGDAAPGSPEATRLGAIMMGWWAALLAASDQDGDDKVSLDELMLVVEQLPQMADEVATTADSMFDAVDADGDGSIGPDEYRQMVTAWKQTDAGVDEVFPLLDLDGDGQISRQEFTALWSDFWIGDDDAAPSRLVFGPV